MRPFVSKAAHRTPPRKDAGGTEIQPPCLAKRSFSARDMIFFNNKTTSHKMMESGHVYLKDCAFSLS